MGSRLLDRLLLLRSLTGSIRSSSSARLVDVATSVIGIDVKDVLVALEMLAQASKVVAAAVVPLAPSVLEVPQEEQRVQQEEVMVVDAVGVLQGVVVQPLVY